MKGNIQTKNKTQRGLELSTFDTGLKKMGFPLPFPWQVFSSMQVAQAIGVSLQTLHNMKMRGTGPRPEPFPDYRGNRIMYRYDNLCEWITGLPVWTFHQQWLEALHPNLPRETEKQCLASSASLIEQRLYRQPKWRRKMKAGLVPVLGGV